MNRALSTVLVLLMVSSATMGQLAPVSLDSEALQIEGCRYVHYDADGVHALRFRNDILARDAGVLNFNPQVARMSSGIRLVFSTESRSVSIGLSLLPFRQEKPATIRIYRDGEVLRDISARRETEAHKVRIDLTSEDGKKHLYRVDFPTTAEVVMTELLLDEGARLHPVPVEKKPVYVALGDSITQGTVGLEGISALSYPYLLSRMLDYELYNLGVGGSRVSPVVGDMLVDWEQIDLITLLIGANDFSWAKVPPERYKTNYIRLLENIRKHHPQTPILCLTLTHTTREKGDSGDPTEAYRDAVRRVVASFRQEGDEHIHLVEGESVSNAEGLQDWVHLNQSGNRIMAEKLFEIIKTLGIQSSVKTSM